MLGRTAARYHGNLINMEGDLGLALSVRELVLAGERYRARLAHDLLGIGPTEMIALGIVQVEGRQTPSELARKVGMTSASVTELLDRLERAQLVKREAHPTDRRKVLVGLTPRAQEAVTTVYRRLDAVLAGATSPDADARHLVTDFLHDAAAALRDAVDSTDPAAPTAEPVPTATLSDRD